MNRNDKSILICAALMLSFVWFGLGAVYGEYRFIQGLQEIEKLNGCALVTHEEVQQKLDVIMNSITACTY